MESIEFYLLISVLIYIAFVLRDIRSEKEKTTKALQELSLGLAKIEGLLTPLPVAPYKTTSQPLPLPK
jgi:hypothetical protein